MLSAGYLILSAGRNAPPGSPVIVAGHQGANIPVSACAGGFGVLLASLLPGGGCWSLLLIALHQRLGAAWWQLD